MKYIIKQKLVALKPTYEVLDAAGNALYKVKGSFLGREKFEITDLEDQTLAKCETNMNFLSIIGSFLRYNLKKYHISVQEQKAISMSRSLNIFSYQMNVDSPILRSMIHKISTLFYSQLLLWIVFIIRKNKFYKICLHESTLYSRLIKSEKSIP
ncbi:uncharacterized protein YxjI [Enterococcus rotai]|uniref:Uncharacterized protein n=1 Tax=Enterococcus rotai TaxID=118060 RepID=A0A0U2XM40_9ENTE|nr:hypothetical protein [Enterococcus rotai]ALS38317.1 hypothetical protein ATZ35_14535 [Enterococcus rotai]